MCGLEMWRATGYNEGMRTATLPTRSVTKSEREMVALCAGLFIGEGCVSNNSPAKARSDGTRALHLSIGMADAEAINWFATTLGRYLPDRLSWGGKYVGGITVAYNDSRYVSGKTMARIHLGGRIAEIVVRVLWPWLEGTDKGAQAERCFQVAGLPAPGSKGGQ